MFEGATIVPRVGTEATDAQCLANSHRLYGPMGIDVQGNHSPHLEQVFPLLLHERAGAKVVLFFQLGPDHNPGDHAPQL